MGNWNFDEIIERRGTYAEKYNFENRPDDTIPLWVADMDFRVCPSVTEALRSRAEHGIYGYSNPGKEYYDALLGWFSSRFGWQAEKDWVVNTPGVVYALNTAVRSLTQPQDAVMILTPVYRPFFNVVQNNGRTLVECPLVNQDGAYQIDFADFERKIIDNNVKMFILCSPHNPIGRVWQKEELEQIADICLRHNVLVVSDEIHADFVYPGYKHIPFASLSKEAEQHCVVCTAPSKTFNLAGLQCSNIFIPNAEIRDAFTGELSREGYHSPNVMGMLACQAAYAEGGPWLDDLIQYLSGNLEFVRSFLRENLPMVRLTEPQGTYLIWLDFRDLGLSADALEDLVSNKARLWLDDGLIFGKEGELFERVNIACPRSLLVEAFQRLKDAVDQLK